MLQGLAVLPAPVLAQLERFVLEAADWVHPAALGQALQQQAQTQSLVGLDTDIDPARAWSAGLRARLVERVAPAAELNLAGLGQDWWQRLALLEESDWLRVGLTVSALPYCGQVQRAMDGHFRRALREAYGAEQWAGLDQYAGRGAPLRFMLGQGAWRQPQKVALAGVRAALEQACPWDEALRRRALLRFAPTLWEQAPSVAGLDLEWLEIACRFTLPEHPWLW